MKPEKTALFIDGSNFYAATRLLNMDVDYAKLHAHFSQNANLIRIDCQMNAADLTIQGKDAMRLTQR